MKCKDSYDCESGEFCNFDDGPSGGVCDDCPHLRDSTCKDSRFITQEGDDECKVRCEGQ